eukprot:15437995-Alexandrium_andersonii.AAC.1
MSVCKDAPAHRCMVPRKQGCLHENAQVHDRVQAPRTMRACPLALVRMCFTKREASAPCLALSTPSSASDG